MGEKVAEAAPVERTVSSATPAASVGPTAWKARSTERSRPAPMPGFDAFRHVGARSLPLPQRSAMEERFRADFSGVVALHTPEIGTLGLRAFARPGAIGFRDRSPTASLVAHELAHILQFDLGRGGGSVRSAEAEAEQVSSAWPRSGPLAIRQRAPAPVLFDGRLRVARREAGGVTVSALDPGEVLGERNPRLARVLLQLMYEVNDLFGALHTLIPYVVEPISRRLQTLVWERNRIERVLRHQFSKGDFSPWAVARFADTVGRFAGHADGPWLTATLRPHPLEDLGELELPGLRLTTVETARSAQALARDGVQTLHTLYRSIAEHPYVKLGRPKDEERTDEENERARERGQEEASAARKAKARQAIEDAVSGYGRTDGDSRFAILYARALARQLRSDIGLADRELGEVYAELEAEEQLEPALLLGHMVTATGELGYTALSAYEGRVTDTVYEELTAVFTGEAFQQALLGEFQAQDQRSISGEVLGTLVTLIPGLDQAADVRDFIAKFYALVVLGEVDSFDHWFGLGTTMIGVVPTVGSAVKGVANVARHAAGPASDMLSLLRPLVSELLKRLDEVNTHRAWIVQFVQSLSDSWRVAKQAALDIFGQLVPLYGWARGLGADAIRKLSDKVAEFGPVLEARVRPLWDPIAAVLGAVAIWAQRKAEGITRHIPGFKQAYWARIAEEADSADELVEGLWDGIRSRLKGARALSPGDVPVRRLSPDDSLPTGMGPGDVAIQLGTDGKPSRVVVGPEASSEADASFNVLGHQQMAVRMQSWTHEVQVWLEGLVQRLRGSRLSPEQLRVALAEQKKHAELLALYRRQAHTLEDAEAVLERVDELAEWKRYWDDVLAGKAEGSFDAEGLIFARKGGKCFVAGTRVLTERGWRAIESLEVGERVLAFEGAAGSVDGGQGGRFGDGNGALSEGAARTTRGRPPGGDVLATVTNTFVRTVDAVIAVDVAYPDGTVDTLVGTPNHPFWVPAEGRYVALEELAVGAVLRTVGGGEAVVVGKGWRRGEVEAAGVPVYDVEVEGLHCFYVAGAGGEDVDGGGLGARGVLVHNSAAKVPEGSTRAPDAEGIGPAQQEMFPAKGGSGVKTHAGVVHSLKDIPTHKSGDFEAWFDSLSADDVAELWKTPAYRRKIETQLRGDGGMHEMLMVAEAPHWKNWGVGTSDVQHDFAIAIEKLNEGGLAKGWTHSTGRLGSKAPGSKTAHNELQAIIQKSDSLEAFRENLRQWADSWIEGGYDALLRELGPT